MYGLSRSPMRALFQKTPITLLRVLLAFLAPRRQADSLHNRQEALEAHLPLLAVVEQRREHLVDVGARADEEEEDEQQRLEVEEGRLGALAAIGVPMNRRQ